MIVIDISVTIYPGSGVIFRVELWIKCREQTSDRHKISKVRFVNLVSRVRICGARSMLLSFENSVYFPYIPSVRSRNTTKATVAAEK